MNVKELMTADPVFVADGATVREALGLMLEADVRHVPVVREGELIGILSDRDVRQYALPLGEEYDDLSDVHARLGAGVGDLMQADVVFVNEETEAAEVARLMIEHRIGAIPVVEGTTQKLVGIVSYVDVLRAAERLL